ncbi:hypothetical protein MUK42_20249, partial [Musa troglodytarum]
MVRGSRVLLLKDGGGGGGNALFKVLSDILVCPLSKQPLRHCPDSRSLVSDAVGVSFPIINGIPCLVPKDGKLLEDEIKLKVDDSSIAKGEGTRRDRQLRIQVTLNVRHVGGEEWPIYTAPLVAPQRHRGQHGRGAELAEQQNSSGSTYQHCARDDRRWPA